MKMPRPNLNRDHSSTSLSPGMRLRWALLRFAAIHSHRAARLLTLLPVIRSALRLRENRRSRTKPARRGKGHIELRLYASSVRGYFRTTICTVPAPLQNRQRSPSMSFPEREYSSHLAVIWNSTLLVSGTLPGGFLYAFGVVI